jgi:hypothetical protein
VKPGGAGSNERPNSVITTGGGGGPADQGRKKITLDSKTLDNTDFIWNANWQVMLVAHPAVGRPAVCRKLSGREWVGGS